MKAIRIIVLVLGLALVLGRAVAMLPPDIFKGPIFAEDEGTSDEDVGWDTEFA